MFLQQLPVPAKLVSFEGTESIALLFPTQINILAALPQNY
jgi:hypothetical protein